MAQDIHDVKKLGFIYDLDENINPLKGTKMLQSSSNQEDNQNILFSNLHALTMIQKLSQSSIVLKSYSCKGTEEGKRAPVSEKDESFVSHETFFIHSPITDNTLNSKNIMQVSNPSTLEKRHSEFPYDSRTTDSYDKHKKSKVHADCVIENHSEAGPDVAEFSEEEFRTVAEWQERNAQDSGLDISGDSNSLNAACSNDKEDEKLNFMTTDSIIHVDMNSLAASKDYKCLMEEDFNQALKMQGLLFHDKHVKRDNEICEQLKLLERDKLLVKSQMIALNKGYRASRGILEELLNIFTVWLKAKEQEHIDITSNSQKILKERDQALEDLQSVESAFADLHRRYENCKTVLEGYKQNEDRVKQKVAEMQMKLKLQEQMHEMLSSHVQDKLESANAEIENAKKSGDTEVTILRAQLKKAEMRISSLVKDLEQKNRENTELSSICDELIAKIGKT